MITFDPTAPCADLLPARPGYMRGAMVSWCPVGRVLELQTDRKRQRIYEVHEFAADEGFGGRAFQLRKLTTGTDPEAEGYAVLISNKGPGWDCCECRGFLRHQHCSHLDGLRCVIAKGWDVSQPTEDYTPTDAEIEAMVSSSPFYHDATEDVELSEDDQAEAERKTLEAIEEARRERAAEIRRYLDAGYPECFWGGRPTTEGVPF